MTAPDTIFANSSGQAPAAIAVVRVSGPRAHAAGQQLCGSLPEARVAALRTLRNGNGAVLDHALLLRFDGPASATGEDVVEFHCHGGRAVVRALLDTLATIEGLRVAEPGEFTRRALGNGRIDLTEAEGLADLLEAETELQRKAALGLAEGGLRKQVERWRTKLIALSAQAEAAIDYVGDEDETAADETAIAAQAQQLAIELADWLKRPRAERLRNGLRVVLAGPPNAGKSSLINALAGEERAIVADVPGTTRDVIEVPVSLAGLPLLLVDTAGLRDSEDQVEQIGVARAQAQAASADILVWLGLPEEAPNHPCRILVHAKVDRPERRAAPLDSVPVSAVTGSGLTTLQQRLLAAARSLLPAPDEISLNQRHAALVEQAVTALAGAAPEDIVLTAEALRSARHALDGITGSRGIEDVLDALFGRFCLGK